MPVTPFHFGPGLLLKAAAPRHVSLTAFIAANVAVDVESGWNLMHGFYPVHGPLHTFLAASLAGVVVGALVYGVARGLGWTRRWPGETAAFPTLLGGWLGGASHVLLDAVMHRDLRPFLPFTDANPLLRVVDLSTLHLFCVATGALGLAWFAARHARRDRS